MRREHFMCICFFFFCVCVCVCVVVFVFFQAEDGIRDLVRSRGLGDVYKRQVGQCRQETEPRHARRLKKRQTARDELFRQGTPRPAILRLGIRPQRALSLIHI